jgi:hypothetical protein
MAAVLSESEAATAVAAFAALGVCDELARAVKPKPCTLDP